jgi:acetyl esterase/lipase
MKPAHIVRSVHQMKPLAALPRHALLALAVAALGAGARAQPAKSAPPAAGERVLRNLAYGPHPERNLLDLYLPAERSPAPLPVIIWLHSGGWYLGDKGNAGHARAYVPRGYAVASVNYRLSQHAVFPAQIEDCQRAVRWIRAHATEYGLDPARIGAWGSSAGGHLVALLGTAAEKFPGAADDPNRHLSAAIAAGCAQNPPTDLLAWDTQALPNPSVIAGAPDSMVERLLGGPLTERRALAELASPLRHVSAKSIPFFLVHGDADRAVPPRQSVTFHAALRAAGVESTLHVIPGAGHVGDAFTQGMPHPAIAAFFDRHLKAGKRVPGTAP